MMQFAPKAYLKATSSLSEKYFLNEGSGRDDDYNEI